MQQQSLISEIESALASGSSERRIETLRRVTDLFMVGEGHYSDEQTDLFDDVISRLADRIETKARAELANRLAPVRNAPIMVLRTLASDDSIEVAGPVLTQSPRLSDADLLASVRSRSQARLLAISKRATLSEAVSDVLVQNGDQEVLRSVASNEGARFSHAGYGRLVERSMDDEVLAVCVGTRKDIPREHFHSLVSRASEQVLKRLAAANPAAADAMQQVLSDITGQQAPKPKVKRDYTDARMMFEMVQRAGSPMDLAVRDFAKAGKVEEVVVALSTLCNLPTDIIENIVEDKRAENDLALILMKSAGLSSATARAILVMRAGAAMASSQAIEGAIQHFERLQAATAQRVVRFYQVRHAASAKGA